MVFKQQWVSWLALGLICLFVYAITPKEISIFDYNREYIIDGEYWRIFTCNFNHTNIYHLILNLSGLAVIGGLHSEYYSGTRFSLLIIYLSLAVGTGIYLYSPFVQNYVGLSGVLHGLLAVGAIVDLFKKRYSGLILLSGVAAKVFGEQFFSADTGVTDLIEATILTDAHLYGFLAGLAISPVVISLLIKKRAIQLS